MVANLVLGQDPMSLVSASSSHEKFIWLSVGQLPRPGPFAVSRGWVMLLLDSLPFGSLGKEDLLGAVLISPRI